MLSSALALIIPGPSSQQSSQENSVATGAPTITGTAQVGETLTAATTGISDDDGLTNTVFAYQWLAGRRNNRERDGPQPTPWPLRDVGKALKVRVTFTDDAGNAETLTSAATTAVAGVVPSAPGGLSVSVNGTGKMNVFWSVPASNGGSAVTGYKVQWKEAAGSWDTPSDLSETTATRNSHTVSGLTDGAEYTFRVVAVNSVGDSPA